jgi:hypothetical protein
MVGARWLFVLAGAAGPASARCAQAASLDARHGRGRDNRRILVAPFVTIPGRSGRIVGATSSRLRSLRQPQVWWSVMARFPGDRVDAAMKPSPPVRPLRGARLAVARMAWIAVFVPTLGLAVAGFLAGFQRPELISPPSIRMALDQAGIPHEVAILIGLVLPWVAFTATGLFLFWRRSDDWVAMLFALLLVVWGGTTIRALERWSTPTPACGCQSVCSR